jgi:hypothetical protein
MEHKKDIGKIYDTENYKHSWSSDDKKFFLYWQENHPNNQIWLHNSYGFNEREMHVSINTYDFYKIAKDFVKKYEKTIKG